MNAIDRALVALPRERVDMIALGLTLAALVFVLTLLLRVARDLPSPTSRDDDP